MVAEKQKPSLHHALIALPCRLQCAVQNKQMLQQSERNAKNKKNKNPATLFLLKEALTFAVTNHSLAIFEDWCQKWQSLSMY